MKLTVTMLLAVAILVSLSQFTEASVEPNDANNLNTLGDYLRYAELNNAELKASFQGWKIAAEQIPQAKSLPDPELTYGYATEPTAQRYSLDVMQKFPWFGTLEAQAGSAEAEMKAAYQKYQAKKLELFNNVKNAFYEYSYLARATEITRENLELVKHFEEVARVRYATSATSHPDVIRAQIEAAKLEDTLKSFEKLRYPLATKLNSILNRPISKDLPWPKPARPGQIIVDSNTLLALMTEYNPELCALGFKINAASDNVKLAVKKSFPNVGIGVGVDAGMGENGSDRTMLKAAITLPIWLDNYTAAQRQAKAQLSQAVEEKNQMENTLAARGQQILYEYEDSGRKIHLYKDSIIPKAREMLKACETAYQAGSLDFLSLIDSYRILLEYQLSYELAITENAQKLAELEMLAGTQLPTIDPASVKNIQDK